MFSIIKLNLILKYFFDFFLSLLLIIILLPLMILITLLIMFIDKNFPIFVQKRSGLNGKQIKVIKFCTIVFKKKKIHISKLGKFLRVTRLDEIPQIFNIFKGDMSFVGPRPLYEKYNKLYNKRQIKRLKVKPGITGWAQINGNNNISWKKKFDLDLWYVKNYSFILDLKIIFMTILFLFRSIFFFKIADQKTKIIDEEFNGKN